MALPVASRSARSRSAAVRVNVALGALQLGAQPIHLGLERARVDLKQYVALPDECAFNEIHRGDDAGHTRPDIHVMHGFEPPGELVPFSDRAATGARAAVT
jgi:hypothetical protein